MSEFNLINTGQRKKDSLTGRVTITESIHYKISMTLVFGFICTIFTLQLLDFTLPGWADFLLSGSVLIGYVFAFLSFFYTQNAGKVIFKDAQIEVHPKKDGDNFPSSPIHLNEHSEIKINIIQSYRFIYERTMLYIEIDNQSQEDPIGFSFVLRNKEEHKQYKELLDSWYKAGYQIHESDQLGNRIFKLKRGINYADVQNIKQQYGIKWQ